MRRFTAVAVALATLAACGNKPPPPNTPVQRETAEDSVLRVGHVWRSLTADKGLRSPPSKISVFESKTTSTVRFEPGKTQIEEELLVEERFELRNGESFECVARGTLRDSVRFGRFHDEAAVQISRPPTTLPRRCKPPGFDEPELAIEGGAARFALRGDQLVAFAPPLDKRVYIPAD